MLAMLILSLKKIKSIIIIIIIIIIKSNPIKDKILVLGLDIVERQV